MILAKLLRLKLFLDKFLHCTIGRWVDTLLFIRIVSLETVKDLFLFLILSARAGEVEWEDKTIARTLKWNEEETSEIICWDV